MLHTIVVHRLSCVFDLMVDILATFSAMEISVDKFQCAFSTFLCSVLVFDVRSCFQVFIRNQLFFSCAAAEPKDTATTVAAAVVAAGTAGN